MLIVAIFTYMERHDSYIFSRKQKHYDCKNTHQVIHRDVLWWCPDKNLTITATTV